MQSSVIMQKISNSEKKKKSKKWKKKFNKKLEWQKKV